jgi:hypothetical protein
LWAQNDFLFFSFRFGAPNRKEKKRLGGVARYPGRRPRRLALGYYQAAPLGLRTGEPGAPADAAEAITWLTEKG